MVSKTIERKREQAREMGAWEMDEDGEYARGKEMVDVIVMVGMFPILGIVYSLVMISTGMRMEKKTGIAQQAIRTGHVGLISQVFWLVLALIFWLV